MAPAALKLRQFAAITARGDFLTRDRIRLWTFAIAAGWLAAILYLALTAHGLNDYDGRPLGSDFSSFYAAGRLAAAGQSPFDQAQLYHMEQAIFGTATPYYAFSYPPIFLLIAAPLAAFSYITALILWQLVGVAFYLAAMALLRRRFLSGLQDTALFFAVTFAFPAVFINLLHGQNGFLSAALFASALSLLEPRPLLAGVCLGLAAYKPQLGLLIPFALAASGHWRSFAAATGTVIALVALSIILFGANLWPDFFHAAQFSRYAILDNEAVGYSKMISPFAALRLVGLSLPLSYIVQTAISIAVIALSMRLWRSNTDLRLKGACLCLGTLLATPFALDYDLMILAPAIMLLTADYRSGNRAPYRALAIVLLWLVPFFARSLGAIDLPAGAGVLLSVFALVVWQERAGESAPKSSPTFA